jgi:hypothetical protein
MKGEIMKDFKLSDVISVYSGILLSNGGVTGLYEVLNYLTGQTLMTHQLPRAANECKDGISNQLPFLKNPEFDFAIAELKEMLKTESGKKEPELLCLGWLAKQEALYGKTVRLKPIPESYNPKNPITEIINRRKRLGT